MSRTEINKAEKNKSEMDKKIKAIMVGLGNTGIPMVQYMHEHGIEITGAVDIDKSLKGKRLSELTGIEGLDLAISDNIEEVLRSADADIALICTVSLVEDLYDTALACLNHGVNVLTTAEKAFSPGYNGNRKLIEALSEAALSHNVTMYASGVQDVLWVTFATVLSGLCSHIDEIHGTNYALIDGFGPLCLEEAFVGKKVEEFEEGEQLNDDFNYALNEVALALDLTVVSEETRISPIICREDVYSPEAGVHVKAGEIIGGLTSTTMETEEGVRLAADFHEKLREEGDTEKNEWVIKGSPSLRLTMDEMYGEYTTCTTVLNRIADVINADAGYISAAQMPAPRYHAHSMEKYVK